MYFDCKKEEDKKRLLIKVQYIIDKEKKVEVTERRGNRTLSQNNYLHLIIAWFCLETGETLKYVKDEYFKKLCSPDIFIVEKHDPYLGKVKILKSSSEIDTKEMTTAIDRFRNWSSMEAGIYLPDANEDKFIEHIQEEMKKRSQWL